MNARPHPIDPAQASIRPDHDLRSAVERPMRRRVVQAAASVVLLASCALAIVPSRAIAAGPAVPLAVQGLDRAAMALFDAAEAADWAGASKAVASARAAAAEVAGLESSFADAGGSVEAFIQVHDNLGGDLIEASTAVSSRDQRWLISSADRIATRAGELSMPFEQGTVAAVPRVETLLFLARRIRRARIWQDREGLNSASDDFNRLLTALEPQLQGNALAKASALRKAFASIGLKSSPADLKRFYGDVQALRDAIR